MKNEAESTVQEPPIAEIAKKPRRKDKKIPETSQQLDAFEKWYKMPVRQFSGTKFGVCPETLQKWSKKFHWAKRVEQRNQIAKRKIDVFMAETITDMNIKHRKEANSIRQKAAEFLISHDIPSFRDAILAWKEGLMVERLVRGEPGSIEQSDFRLLILDARTALNRIRQREKQKRSRLKEQKAKDQII